MDREIIRITNLLDGFGLLVPHFRKNLGNVADLGLGIGLLDLGAVFLAEKEVSSHGSLWCVWIACFLLPLSFGFLGGFWTHFFFCLACVF